MTKKNYLRLAAVTLLLGLIVGLVVDRLSTNTARAGLLLTHAGFAGAPVVNLIDPTTVPGLAMWIDPSDSTTVFTDTACSSLAPSSPSGLLCIKDKSTHGCNMTHSGGTTTTWTQVSTTPAVGNLAFNGVEILSSTCLSIFQNIPRAIVFIAAQVTDPATTSGVIFFAATNTAGTARFSTGYSTSGGTGWMMRMRNLDADTGVNIATGTTSAVLTETRSDAEFINAAPNMTLVVNPGASTFTGSTGTVSSNTSNTASTGVVLGQNDSGASAFTGPLYQLLVYTPTSALSAGTMAQLDTFTCAKAGITC